MVAVILIVFASIKNNCGFSEQSLSNNAPNSGEAKTPSQCHANRRTNPENESGKLRREQMERIPIGIMVCSEPI